MKPTFTDCGLVITNPKFPAQYLQTLDIVVIDVSDRNAAYSKIVHRVVQNFVSSQELTTRGDNDAFYDFPSSIDGLFDYEKVLGKVTNYYGLPVFMCGE